jgi:hypothetical protein
VPGDLRVDVVEDCDAIPTETVLATTVVDTVRPLRAEAREAEMDRDEPAGSASGGKMSQRSSSRNPPGSTER